MKIKAPSPLCRVEKIEKKNPQILPSTKNSLATYNPVKDHSLVAKFHRSIAWQGNTGKLRLERSVMHLWYRQPLFCCQRRHRTYFSVDHLGY